MKRLNNVLLATLMLFFITPCTNSFGQNQDPNMEANIENLLAPLDMSAVTSNILMSRTITPRIFQEARQSYKWDSLYMNIESFDLLYSCLYAGRIPGSSFPHPNQAYRDTLESHVGLTIPIVIGAFDYHKIDTLAVSNGNLDYINGQLHNVTGVPSQDPYNTNRVYGSFLFSEVSDFANLNLSLSSDFILGNVGISHDSIFLDADDSLGYRQITLDSLFPISFSSNGDKIMKLKFRDIDGNETLHYLKLQVSDPSLPNLNHQNMEGKNAGFFCAETGDFTEAIAGPETNLFLTYDFACGETLQSLKKPFIILDGFDTAWRTNTTDAASILGSVAFGLGFIHPSILPGSGPSGSNPSFLQILQDNDYDVIVVDYFTTHAAIEDNGRALQEAIKHINNIKRQNGSSYPNVMMGRSMGGLVGKWALLDMESKDEDHQMDTYITFDSPMQGANIPIAYQAVVNQVLSYKIPFGEEVRDIAAAAELADLGRVLDSPVAQQMLIYTEKNTLQAKAVHETFYASLESYGELQNCEYIGISNGSIKGVPGTQSILPRDNLFTVTNQVLNHEINIEETFETPLGDFTLSADISLNDVLLALNILEDLLFGIVNVNIDICMRGFASPGLEDFFSCGAIIPTGGNDLLYEGHIPVEITVSHIPKIVIDVGTHKITTQFDIRSQGIRSIDSAPGGIVAGNVPSNLPIGVSANLGSFCFMPTVSALDLQPIGTDFLFTNEYIAPDSSIPTPLKKWVGEDQSFTFEGQTFENHPHLSMAYHNATLILDQLLGFNELAGLTKIAIGKTFNFGKGIFNQLTVPFTTSATSKYIDQSLDILDNAKLLINSQGPIGFTDNPNAITNLTNESFDVYIVNNLCNGGNTIVNFFSGSELKVGDPSVSNQGSLTVGSDTELHLFGGSNSLITANSKLIVDNNAEVHIYDNAQVILDANAQIVLKDGAELFIYDSANLDILNDSRLIVEDGAILHWFEGGNIYLENTSSDYFSEDGSHIEFKGSLVYHGTQLSTTGNGYLLFSGGDGGSHLYCDNKITINGHGKNGLKFIHNTDELTVHKSTIFNECHILNQGVFWFDNLNSIQFDECYSYQGLYHYNEINQIDLNYSDFKESSHECWNTDILFAKNSTFYDNEVVPAIKSYYADAISLAFSDFYRNKCSVQSFDTEGFLQFDHVTFTEHNISNLNYSQVAEYNYQVNPSSGAAIQLYGLAPLYMTSVLIDDATVGISSYQGAPIFLREESIISNSVIAINITGDFDNGLVDMSCSKLIDNNRGIRGTDVLLNIDAFEHGLSYDCRIHHNSFIDHAHAIRPMFDIQYIQRDIPIIQAKGNYWQNDGPYPEMVNYIIVNGSSSSTLDYSDNEISDPVTCPGDLICDPGPPSDPNQIFVSAQIPFSGNNNYFGIFNTPNNWLVSLQNLYGISYHNYLVGYNGSYYNSEGFGLNWTYYDQVVQAFQEISDLSCQPFYQAASVYNKTRIDVARAIVGDGGICSNNGSNNYVVQQTKPIIDVSITPNPTSRELTFYNLQEFDTLELIDQMGRIKYSQKLSEESIITVDINSFVKGIYFARLYNNEEDRFTSLKWIKM